MHDSTVNDKRSSPRKPIQDKQKAEVEITLPYPKGYKIKKEVVDLSETGFSFIIPSEEGYLAKGTPLKEIKLTYYDKVFQLSGEVAYVAKVPVGDGLDFRIGVQVSKNINLDSNNNGDHRDQFRFRPKRYNFEFLSNLGGVFSCSDKNFELTGEIINISKFGAAFKTKNDIILKPSQTLNNVKIIFHDEIIFSGNVTVINVRENINEIIVGVSFQNNLADFEQLTDLKKRVEIRENIQSFVQALWQFDEINPKFKAEVMNLRFYLGEIEEKVMQEEKKIKYLDLEKQLLIEMEILNVLQNDIKSKLDQSLINIYELVKDLSNEEHYLNKHYFQKNLHLFILKSPFWERVYKKPLGYAGDYEMISMLVRNKQEGSTLFAKLIHSYIVSTSPAQAVRNRVHYLKNKILNEVMKKKSSGNNSIKITSIGSGPALEIQEVLPLIVEHEDCEINLIDFDEAALNYSYIKLSEIQQKLKSKVTINYFHLSIREILKKGELIHNLPSQSLIYCTGLFDYLSVPICKRISEVAFSNIIDGGRLIVGNFSNRNKIRAFMEYGGEWYLLHRTIEEFLQVVPNGVNMNKVIPEEEETGINLFLSIHK